MSSYSMLAHGLGGLMSSIFGRQNSITLFVPEISSLLFSVSERHGVLSSRLRSIMHSIISPHSPSLQA